MHKGLDVRENLSCWEMAVGMAVTETGGLEVIKRCKAPSSGTNPGGQD